MLEPQAEATKTPTNAMAKTSVLRVGGMRETIAQPLRGDHAGASKRC